MRLLSATCVAALCALPAYGEQDRLSDSELHALTPIDSVPSKSALNVVFGSAPDAARDGLLKIVREGTDDFGVEIRAIRALPVYCPPAPASCAGTVVHASLAELVRSKQSLQQQTAQDLLRMRAAVEALGQTRTGLAEDVDLLAPLLSSTSRDLRATVARALLNICNRTALLPLDKVLGVEQVEHVKAEMRAAVRELAHCAE